jgi:hypothetical protein
MKILIITVLLFIAEDALIAQVKLFTKTASISFYSKSLVENIEARNNKAVGIWELSSGKIEFSVLMKGFEFEKALMEQHFNEDYVESDKYPKAVFKGVVENGATISLTEDKNYKVKINGLLTLHGVTKSISISADVEIKKGIVNASANLNVLLSDYNIKIPAVAVNNINNQITINLKVPVFQKLATN